MLLIFLLFGIIYIFLMPLLSEVQSIIYALFERLFLYYLYLLRVNFLYIDHAFGITFPILH